MCLIGHSTLTHTERVAFLSSRAIMEVDHLHALSDEQVAEFREAFSLFDKVEKMEINYRSFYHMLF